MYNFSKYEGLGNDFIIIDDPLHKIQELISNKSKSLVKKLCNRNFGIGSDGLLIASPPASDGFINMRIFNADGSEAEMCGNGIRCMIKYLLDLSRIECHTPIKIETLAGIISSKALKNGDISVEMGIPILTPNLIPTKFSIGPQGLPEGLIYIFNKAYKAYSVGMGNPHLIIPVENLKEIDITKLGPILEMDSNFPEKTNVHFIEIDNQSRVNLLVWERGAGITLACGTGACASFVAAFKLGLTYNHSIVSLPGGDLSISWPDEDSAIKMTGPANLVYKGRIDIDSF